MPSNETSTNLDKRSKGAHKEAIYLFGVFKRKIFFEAIQPGMKLKRLKRKALAKGKI